MPKKAAVPHAGVSSTKSSTEPFRAEPASSITTITIGKIYYDLLNHHLSKFNQSIHDLGNECAEFEASITRARKKVCLIAIRYKKKYLGEMTSRTKELQKELLTAPIDPVLDYKSIGEQCGESLCKALEANCNCDILMDLYEDELKFALYRNVMKRPAENASTSNSFLHANKLPVKTAKSQLSDEVADSTNK